MNERAAQRLPCKSSKEVEKLIGQHRPTMQTFDVRSDIVDGLYIEQRKQNSQNAALVVSGVHVICGGDNSPF